MSQSPIRRRLALVVVLVLGITAIAAVRSWQAYAQKKGARSAPSAAAILITSHTVADTAGVVDGNADPGDALTSRSLTPSYHAS